MKAKLIRKYEEGVTLGRFYWDNEELVKTIELPWKDNKPFVSCIPEDTYLVAKTHSPRFGEDTFEVIGVKGRSGIRFHIANFALKELEGCIAPCLSFKDLDKDGIIDGYQSGKALIKFYDTLPNEFELTITSES